MKPDNDKPKQIIFMAELVDVNGEKKIKFTRNSAHIHTLDHIAKELDYMLTELRAIEKLKEQLKNAPIVQLPKGGLINFLRKGHKK